MEPEVDSRIREALRELEAAWCAFDFERVRALWDGSRPPIYLAEEAEPALSWDALEAYWRATRESIVRVAMRIDADRLVLRELAPGLVTALYPMHWDAQMKHEAEPIGGEVRVCATLRLTPAGWRFAQYVEAPLAPIVYMRRLYRLAADPEFRAPAVECASMR
jgi:hypothetical protein